MSGGIIGKLNNPTASSASGVWGLREQLRAKRDDVWPRFEQDAQWNSADKDADITLSNGDRDATTSGAGSVRGLLGRSSGKYYFEILLQTNVGNSWYGFADGSFSLASYPGNATNSAGYASFGNKVSGWTHAQTATGGTAANDVMGYALDLTTGYAWIAKNNSWLMSGNPAAGTTPWVTGISGTIYPAFGWFASFASGGRINTKTAELSYTPPSGFSNWAAAT